MADCVAIRLFCVVGREIVAEKSGGLDFEVEGRCEEVQKERAGVADWTLKRRGGMRKSKRGEKEWQIGL